MTFGSAGDIGDLIYSLPTVRALGGGTLCLHAERWTREPMTEAKVQSIRSLLITQPYIADVRWLNPGEKVDVNLNDFRAPYFRDFRKSDFPQRRNLCEWILRTHGCDPDEQNKQWLEVEPIRTASVIINRTGSGRQAQHVYQNRYFPWRKVLHQYRDAKVEFVGSPGEHMQFIAEHGAVAYVSTPTLLDVARVIAGADLFIGNQSCAYAIAEGLKRPAVLEVCPSLPNCLFYRPHCYHGFDAFVPLPDLSDLPDAYSGQNVNGESVEGFTA